MTTHEDNQTESPEVEQISDIGPAWESELDVYPLRAPEEDPRWAMWVFWIWVIFCTGMLVFLTVITILGWFYD